MQRFLISVIFVTVLSWVLFLTFASRTNEAGILQDLIFSVLLFLVSSFTLSLIIYFSRVLISKIISRGRLRTEEAEFVDMRPVFRRSFKMAIVVSSFIAVLAFLKLEELLNLFNLSLLAVIVILGAIWLRK